MSKKKSNLDKTFDKVLVIISELVTFSTSLYNKVLYFFTGKDYFNNKHLEVIFEGFSIKMRWFSHDDFVKYKLEKLKVAREESESIEEFLGYLLSECRKCVYLIIDCGNDNKFVQFWLGDGKLMADFPIKKTNGLHRYRYAMLGVLNELNIHEFRSGTKKPRRVPYYQHINFSDFETYEIYFQSYPNEAVKFIKMMFEEVYKEKLENLKYKIA